MTCRTCEGAKWGTTVPLPGVFVMPGGYVQACDECAAMRGESGDDVAAASALVSELAKRGVASFVRCVVDEYQPEEPEASQAPEVVNLDAMTRAELKAFIDAPSDLPFELKAYARRKAKAMLHRERGEIERATRLETECDSIYRMLPKAVQW